MTEATAAAALRELQQLPGPRGWPWLGNAPQLQRSSMHLQLEEWMRRYGDLFTFRIGARRFLVLADPDSIAAVLRDRPEGFKRTSRLEQISREMGFLGLFSANGDDWRRQRPMVLGGLDPAHIKAFFPTLVDVTARLARRWQRAAGQAIDLQADLMRYTVDVTTALAFGQDLNTLESDDAQRIQTHLNHVLPALFRRLLAPFEYWKYFSTRADKEVAGHLLALREAVRGFMAATRGTLAAQPELRAHPVNLIQAMVAAADGQGGAISEADVSGNILTMLLAGEDTTANTLAWTIWLLRQNPAALHAAAAEVADVLQGASVPQDVEQLSQLDWLEACAQEAMRLKPVAPLIIIQAQRDTVIADVRVPGDSLVMCLMRPGGMDDRKFAEPQSFRPERWLQAEGAAAHSLGSAKRSVMPFGAGPRMCPGRYLALAEIKMVLAMLLANFEIREVATPDGQPPQENLAFTMAPVGLAMKLAPRHVTA
jgi:cytochrome P450